MLTPDDTDIIIAYVKQEPRTVQDIATLIKKSWVTTDNYLQRIKDSTGLLNIKTFRKGSQGALKIVYYNHAETPSGDDLQQELARQIKSIRKKEDFDFLDIFQHIPDEKKRTFIEEYDDDLTPPKQDLIPFLRLAERSVYVFSGNLSFINLEEQGIKVKDEFEDLIKRKVNIKIICRVNVASLSNITALTPLLSKYPEHIEIRHAYQPLRGLIIDDTHARFKCEESVRTYKPGELNKNMRIFYELHDPRWVAWLQKVFWSMYRFSISYDERIQQLKKYF